MKKKLALLIGVLFALIAVLASCGQAAPTAKYVRINQNEKHTFKISLSDFSNASGSVFNSYTLKSTQTDEDGKVNETTRTCYKDDVITSTENILMDSADQIRPVDASGTYTMEITDGATTITLVTEQVIYSQYETAKLNELNCLDKLSDYNVTDKSENPFTENDGRTTLRSKTNTSVVFNKDENQLPVSSYVENEGFYIGKIAQSVSNYKYETTYDLANGKVSVKKDGGEAVERTLKLSRGGTCIDANQMLLYIRSLDKSSNAFQDSPSVSVYDVTTDTVYTAAFALSREFNLVLNNNGKDVVVSVNAILSTVGNLPFVAQYNLPDITSKGHDTFPLSGDSRPKYTTVKFRSGWYSYEMQPDETYQQVINDINLDGEISK